MIFDSNGTWQCPLLHFMAVLCRERKKALLLLMQRSPQQAAEEDEILARAKVIEAKRKAEEAAARGPSIETPPPAGNPKYRRVPNNFTLLCYCETRKRRRNYFEHRLQQRCWKNLLHCPMRGLLLSKRRRSCCTLLPPYLACHVSEG